jgi:orotidine-5'-phosphate decarboxylase
MSFLEKLLTASRQRNSLLCVGLDPEPEKLPEIVRGSRSISEATIRFCQEIIGATTPYVCAYKPNLAFFEALGPEGMVVLREVLQAIPAGIPVIGDAKRGDIGSSAARYATALFEVYGFDAVTVNPYLGYDSVAPFLSYREKGVFLLCRTSNPGARDFQDLRVLDDDGEVRALYEVVASRTQGWNGAGNCGLVVGATYPDELRAVRALCPNLPILVPGVGAQGGDLEAAIVAGVNARGERAIVAVSRAIMYAGKGRSYASEAGEAARQVRDRINAARTSLTAHGPANGTGATA